MSLLIFKEVNLRPRAELFAYAGVALDNNEWKLDLWLSYLDHFVRFEGILDHDFGYEIPYQDSVNWDSDTGYIDRQHLHISPFPVGEISPGLMETFLIQELRSEILDAVEQKDWKVLAWLKQHGVTISRQSLIAPGDLQWVPAVLPAIPFEEKGLATDSV